MKKDRFQNLPKWLLSNVFYRAHIQSHSGDHQSRELVEVHPLDANLISSKKANGNHMLLLDLDQDSYVVPSTTNGHNHVYIDADLSFEALEEIVDVLAKHGILQQGIKQQLQDGKCLTLRAPGIKKGDHVDNVGVEEYKEINNPQATQFSPSDLNILDTFSIPPPIIQPKHSDAFKQFKSSMAASSAWDLDFHINKGIYRVSVTEEVLDSFINTSFTKLGLDYKKAVFLVNDHPIETNYTEGYISYQGSRWANLYYNYLTNSYMVEFKKEFFDGDFPGGIPQGWPDWKHLVKSIPNF